MARGGSRERDIWVRVLADTMRYQRTLEAATRLTQKNTTAMERAVHRLEDVFGKLNSTAALAWGAVGGAAAAAAATKLVRVAKSALDAANRIQDLADQLQISTTALQEYRFAGQQAGMTTEQVDKALEQFVKRVGKAAEGQGALVKIAEKHNLRLKATDGSLRGVGALLDEYADVVAGAASAQERAVLVAAAFGDEGTRMAGVLADGAAGFRLARDQAHAFGSVLDADLIGKATLFNNELDALADGLQKAFQQGILTGVTAEMEAIEETLLRLRPLAQDLGSVLGAVLRASADAALFLAENMGAVEVALLALAGGKAGAVFGPWGAAAGAVTGALIGLADATRNLPPTMDETKQAVERLGGAYAVAADQTDTLAAAQLRLAQETARAQIRALEAEKRTIEGRAINEGALSGYGGGKARGQSNAEAERIKEINEQIAKLNVALGGNIAVTAERNAELERGTEVVNEGLDAETKALTIKGRYNQELKQQIEEEYRRRQAVEATIQDLRDQLDVAKALRDAGADEAAVLEVTLRLRRELGQAYGANAAEIEALIRQVRQVTAETEAMAEAQRKAEEAAAEAAEAMAAIWDEAARDMFDTWRDGWRDLLAGKIKNFEDFAKRILNIGLDLAANLIAAQTWQGTFGQLGGAGASAGGRSGQINTGNLLSGASLAGGFKGLTTLSASTPFLGAAGGALGGSMIGGALGLSKTGSAIGGAAGGFGALPFVLAGGNPLIGAGFYLASTLLGGALGKLFNGKPSDKTEGAILNLQTGSLRDVGFSGAKDSPENTEAVYSFIDAVKQFKGILEGATGGRVRTDEIDYRVGDLSGIKMRLGAVSGTYATAQDAFKAVMETFTAELEGITPRMRAALDAIDFTDLETATAALERIVAREGTLQSIRDQLAEIADPKAFALDRLAQEFDALRQEFADDAEALVDIEALAAHRRAEILRQFADEVVEEIAPDTADALDVLGEAFDRVRDEARRLSDERLAQLSDERQLIEAAAQAARGVLDGVGAAKLRRITDPRLSGLSGEQRLNTLTGMLEAAFAAYQSGAGTGEDIAELALAATEANFAFNASSEEAARIDARIAEILDGTETLASRSLRVAEMNLAANQAQVALLQSQLNALDAARAGVGAGNTRTAAELDALTKAYGLSGAPLPGTALFDAFESELLKAIDGLGDANRLLADLVTQEGRMADPTFGASAARIAGGIRAQLRELGVPGFEGGGMTPGLGSMGGASLLHRGELVYTGPSARVFSRSDVSAAVGGGGIVMELRALREDVQTQTRMQDAAFADQDKRLAALAARIGSLEGAL